MGTAFSRFFSRLRVALRLARRDLAAHKVRTLVALLLFALPVSLVVGFASMKESVDHIGDASPIHDVGSVRLDGNDVDRQHDELSAALGDLVDGLSPGWARQLSATHGDRHEDIDAIALSPSADGSGPAVDSGTVVLNDNSAFLLGVSDGDTVTVADTPLTVKTGAGTGNSVVNAGDFGSRPTGTLTWFMPDHRGTAEKIRTAVYDSPDLKDADVSVPFSTSTDWPDIRGYGAYEFGLIIALPTLVILLISSVISPVFAVAARRQRRAMGLMSATGSSPGDLRLVMLTQGLVVGLLGSALGLTLSTGVGAALIRLTSDGRFAWSWQAAVPVVVVALVCGVTSALVPAVQAGRQDPVRALDDGGSSLMRGFRLRMLTGPVIAVAGLVIIAVSPLNYFLGITLCGIGVVLSSGLVVWLLSRLGSRLPTTGRLAVRDSHRNSHRTVPAVAAVAGVTFLAVLATTTPQMWNTSTPYRNDVVTVEPNAGGDREAYSDIIDTVSQKTGAVAAYDIMRAEYDGTADHRYDAVLRVPWEAPGDYFSDDDIMVTDGQVFDTYRDMRREDVAAATAALADGRAVVSDPDLIVDGQVRIDTWDYDDWEGSRQWQDGATYDDVADSVTVPAVAVPSLNWTHSGYSVAMSPATARGLGMDLHYSGTVLRLDAPVSTFRAAAVGTGQWPLRSLQASVQTPAVNGQKALVTAVPVILGWILTLGTVLLVVVLAATESRRDMATITAVGAAPGLLRRFSAAQAIFIALGGTVVGGIVALLSRVATGGELWPGGPVDPWYNTALISPSQWTAVVLTAVVGPVLAWATGSVIGAVASRDKAPVRRR